MPLSLITIPGSAVIRAKINEIIAAINAMQALLTGGAVTQMTWAKIDFAEQELANSGTGIDSVEFIGGTTRVHFTEPFASVHDYSVQLTAETDSFGAVNIDECVHCNTDYVDFYFGTDGGGTITPLTGFAHILIIYNASL